MNRIPTHPGAILREDVLPDAGIGKADLARRLGLTRQALHNLLMEKARITPETALALERVFGSSAESWLALQSNHDLARLRQGADTADVAQA